MNSKGTAFIKAIDISNYQKNADLAKVKSAGVQAVMVKATEGTTFTNPIFKDQVEGLKAAGIPFGCYHWLTVQSPDYAKKQADYFWNTIKDTGFSVLPALDVEERKADKSEITAEVKAFCEEFEAISGIRPMIYASTNYIKDLFDSSISVYPLWVAHYGVSAPDDNGVWNEYVGWQYSSSGTVDGITGNVDCDWFTPDVFIPASAPAQPVQAQAAKPTPTDGPGVYRVTSYPYGVNGIAKCDIPVYDGNGNPATGHNVSKGDSLCIIRIDNDRLMTEVVYPVSGGYMHGYIKTVDDQISNTYWHQWHNGSTLEPTYDSVGNRIGALDPHEFATPLYRSNGKLCLAYDTAKGPGTKTGFVAYNGGFNKF